MPLAPSSSPAAFNPGSVRADVREQMNDRASSVRYVPVASASRAAARWAPHARTAIPYVTIVVALNVGFSLYPEHDWFWSLLVGSVLVLRDYAQRVWGHACLLLMGLAAVLSYLLGSPAVALASATAFAVSETVDWLVYSLTRRPFADRVLLSTAASAPIDSTVFLVLAHLFSWQLLAIGVASKWSAGVVVWATLRWRRHPGRVEAAAC